MGKKIKHFIFNIKCLLRCVRFIGVLFSWRKLLPLPQLWCSPFQSCCFVTDPVHLLGARCLYQCFLKRKFSESIWICGDLWLARWYECLASLQVSSCITRCVGREGMRFVCYQILLHFLLTAVFLCLWPAWTLALDTPPRVTSFAHLLIILL